MTIERDFFSQARKREKTPHDLGICNNHMEMTTTMMKRGGRRSFMFCLTSCYIIIKEERVLFSEAKREETAVALPPFSFLCFSETFGCMMGPNVR